MRSSDWSSDVCSSDLGDPDMRAAEGDEGRHVEAAHADDEDVRMVRREFELARVRVVEGGLRLDAGTPHQRHRLVQDAALRQGDDQRFVLRPGPLSNPNGAGCKPPGGGVIRYRLV